MARLLSIIAFEAVFLPTLIYALLRGGPSERAAILVLATAFSVTPLLVSGYSRFEGSHVAISCVSFTLLLSIALRSEKFWPLWLAALQGLVVLSHVAALLNHQVSAWTYYISTTIWSLLQLILVAIATWEHRRYWLTRPAVDPSQRSSPWWPRTRPRSGREP